MDFEKLSQRADDFFKLPQTAKTIDEMKDEVMKSVLSFFDNTFAQLAGCTSKSDFEIKDINYKFRVIKNLRDIMCVELGLEPGCCEIVVSNDKEKDNSFCGPFPKIGCKEYCIISIPADNIVNDNICELIFQMRHELEHFKFNYLRVNGKKVPAPIPSTCMKYGEMGMIAYDANVQEFRCNNAGVKDLFAYLSGAKILMGKQSVMYKNYIEKALKLMADYWQSRLNEFCSVYYTAIKKGGAKFAKEIEIAERAQTEILLADEILKSTIDTKRAVLNLDKSVPNYNVYKLLYDKFSDISEYFYVHQSLYSTKCLLCDYKYFDSPVYVATGEKIRYALMVPESYYKLGNDEFAEAVQRDIDDIAKEIQDVGEWE